MSELKDEDLTVELSFNELKESIIKHYAKGEYKQSSIIILRDIFRVAQQANETSTSQDKALDIDLVIETR